ncbi:secretion protein HlyD [Georgenia thermotolerans]|uniref:Secretion protein HlyD n=1 Tax=Georgenia thermotolerans TaxID=527326 RepID=A0A7J5UQJ2_9MICO|nr:secretion protein HlyD [Georgenia thermotolerans]KAE8764649.1 secretion protein HlyD [Georgenia thermotolerans]
MTVARHVVFPALRLLVWAVIAAALVKLAFFGGAAAAPAGPVDVPGAVFTDPVATVTTGTVSNTVTVDATVTADPAVEARATMEGTVGYFAVADGAHVEAGAPLLEIRQEVPVDPVERVDAEGNVTVVQQRPRIKRSTVAAPVTGTVSLKVLRDQQVGIGDVVAAVTPGTFSVTGPLTAEQQYRLLDAPSEASVEVRGGPAPFTCTGLTTGTEVTPGAGGASGPGDPFAPPAEPSATVEVRCAVPGDVRVFPGLAGTMTVTAGQASDVLVVPVTAVQGLFATGNVWVVGPDGAEPTKTSVGLGMTDGQVVQITEGLAEGDTILEFIPVGDVPPVGGPGTVERAF